jgi:hypothetical protein
MSTVIEATYDGKVLTPVNPSALKPNTRYRLQVDEALAPAAPPTAWDMLEKMAGTLTKPADWAAGHDAYFYPPAKADKTP